MQGHVVPPKVYVAVFAALLTLTAITVSVAYIDLGPLNAWVAMSIACVKGLLIVLFFMHARYGNRILWVLMGAALLWLTILIVLTMSDYATRGWLPFARG
jgi:cytochrome c oxidase subunit 4